MKITMLIKAGRWSAWILLVLVIIYIFTGFSMTDRFGITSIIPFSLASYLHEILVWPLILTMSIHSAGSIYLAMKRWDWLK